MNETSVLSAIDLVPTLLAVAGARPPADVRFDGEPLPDALLGRSEASREAPLFFRRPPDRDTRRDEEDLPDLAVRDGSWKLLCEYDGSAPQLYNLAEDRGETTNVAAENPDVVERLTRLVLQWHASLPPDNGPGWNENAG